MEKHCFESAGLGTAPFRCIGFAERVQVIGIMPPVTIRPTGTCAYCGTGIRNAYIIRSADGRVFDVGCDCVERVDPELWQEFKARRRAERNAAVAAERARNCDAARAKAKADGDEREAAWRGANPDLSVAVDELMKSDDYAGNYAGRALSAIRQFGRESAALEDVHATKVKLRCLYAELHASGHVGTVGKRETFSVVLVGRIAFDTNFGTKSLYKFLVTRADGSTAMATWSTGSGLYLKGEDCAVPTVGQQLVITATVKKHGEYRGADQTTIARVSAVAA